MFLNPAYHLLCEVCLEESFFPAISVNPNAENAEEIYREVMEVELYEELPDDWRDRLILHTCPSEVTCKHCGAEYRTTNNDEELELG